MGLARPPNTVHLSLLSSHLFPAWRGLPVRYLLSLNLHRMLRGPPSLRVFSSPYLSARLSVRHCSLDLVSDVDAGLPVGSCTCRPQGSYADSVIYPTAGNSGPPGQGLNDAAPLSAGKAHPSQRDEHTVELVRALLTGRPKPRSSHQRRWGLPMHAKPLPQSS
ncbi:hypothetical protein G5714_007702 [Onychostoma macrolepis]|uniref:Uncharacterized protein n=1 Tax=Onychostoma macrolepis TaxID=369639 RepID=A0A7J6CU68_9TELE|nr:hypothetical protein G5714_007702 [Onychostoma macrolepis]